MFPCVFLAKEVRCELTTSATTAPSLGLALVLRVKVGIYWFVRNIWEKNGAMPAGSTTRLHLHRSRELESCQEPFPFTFGFLKDKPLPPQPYLLNALSTFIKL